MVAEQERGLAMDGDDDADESLALIDRAQAALARAETLRLGRGRPKNVVG